MKVYGGCMNGNTPPAGLYIYQKTGKKVPSMNLVSSIKEHIHKLSTTGGENGTQMVPILSSSCVTQYPVPSIVNNNPSLSHHQVMPLLLQYKSMGDHITA